MASVHEMLTDEAAFPVEAAVDRRQELLYDLLSGAGGLALGFGLSASNSGLDTLGEFGQAVGTGVAAGIAGAAFAEVGVRFAHFIERFEDRF